MARKGKIPASQVAQTTALELRAKVWDLAGEERSRWAIARALKIPWQQVDEILGEDLERWVGLVDVATERLVSGWETAEAKALDLIHRNLALFADLLAEIEAATREGRLTSIRNAKGIPLSITEAMSQLVAMRLHDQLLATAEKARKISAGYRHGQPNEDDADTERRRRDELLSVETVAQRVLDAGLTLPPLLAAKLKQVSSTLVVQVQRREPGPAPKTKPPADPLKGRPAAPKEATPIPDRRATSPHDQPLPSSPPPRTGP